MKRIVEIRKLQRHGNSVVLPIPSKFKAAGFTLGKPVVITLVGGELHVALSEYTVCDHCQGNRTCRCRLCTGSNDEPLVASTCTRCKGTGRRDTVES